MSDNEKAAHILAYLAKMYRPACFLEVEDIEEMCTSEELSFYFTWLCLPLR